MAREKFWTGVGTLLFISDGTANGLVRILATKNIKVKQKVLVKSSTQNSKTLEVKFVVNETDVILGPQDKGTYPNSTEDLTNFKVSEGASITIEDQARESIYPNEWTRSVFEEEPTVAIRTIDVGPLGKLVNWHEDGLVPQEYDDVQLTRDGEGDITEAFFYMSGILIRQLELSYDLNKDVIRVQKVA